MLSTGFLGRWFGGCLGVDEWIVSVINAMYEEGYGIEGS